jgi:hypothetical protein
MKNNSTKNNKDDRKQSNYIIVSKSNDSKKSYQ